MRLSETLVGEGLMRQYLEFVEVHEAPLSYHFTSLLTLFGALLERRLIISRGYTVRGNIYALLLGPPASRKTYATRIARQVFAEAGYALETVGENATDEGLLKHMQRKELNGESPHAVVVAEEFGMLLGKKTYQEGLTQWLCRAYDGDRIANVRGEASYGVSDSFLTILAGTTPKSLRDISSSVIGSGLTSRLWIVREHRKERWVARPKWDRIKRARLVAEMAERIRPLMAMERIVFDPGATAENLFEEWYMGPHRQFVESCSEDLEYWAGRRHDHAVKAAVLLHLLDTGDLDGMGEAAMQRGIEFVEAMEPGMFEAYAMLGQSEWGEIWEKMIECLRRKPGMEVRHLMAAASKWVRKPREAREALEDMLRTEMLRAEGSGGTMKLWLREEVGDDHGRKEGSS